MLARKPLVIWGVLLASTLAWCAAAGLVWFLFALLSHIIK